MLLCHNKTIPRSYLDCKLDLQSFLTRLSDQSLGCENCSQQELARSISEVDPLGEGLGLDSLNLRLPPFSQQLSFFGRICRGFLREKNKKNTQIRKKGNIRAVFN